MEVAFKKKTTAAIAIRVVPPIANCVKSTRENPEYGPPEERGLEARRLFSRDFGMDFERDINEMGLETQMGFSLESIWFAPGIASSMDLSFSGSCWVWLRICY